ncbi:MAG: dihydrodipicolinate reductase [Thermoplasmata archaeon]
MGEDVRVVAYGLGAIGSALARECISRGLDIVAAVDIDEGKVGRDIGDVIGLQGNVGVTVRRDLREAVRRGDADVLLHCTTSYIWEAHPQLAEAFLAGCNVVSTCEELSYPWRSHRHFAQEIDQAARREGVTALGTGVNPGFVMDALVIALSSMCTRVDSVQAIRVVDVAKRRLPLQRKVGAGLTKEEFEAMVKEGRLGHVGTYESLDMVGAAFGWNLSSTKVDIEPVMAPEEVSSRHLNVPEGRVAGLRQIGVAHVKGKEVIRLELEMYMGAERPRDVVVIDGKPGLQVEIPDGIMGDEATIAAVVNAIPRVLGAQPGLKTMLDLPLLGYVEHILSTS